MKNIMLTLMLATIVMLALGFQRSRGNATDQKAEAAAMKENPSP